MANREIKLRIRLKSKLDGKEITLFNSVFDAMNGIAFYEIDRSEWEFLSSDEFTSLKDKNGKEIYEGDIIKRHTGYIFKQEFKEFKLGTQNDSSCFGYNYHPLDEVIGNIHKTPELL